MPEPGYIDLHTHGLGKSGTRTDCPEEIIQLARSHSKRGTALILPAIYTAPIGQMRKWMEVVRTAMGSCSLIGGINLEGPFVNPLKMGALGTEFEKPSLTSLKKLLAGFEDEVKIITIAPELPGALKLIEYCAGRGIGVNMGHSGATFHQALEGKKAGARGITHLFNAMRGFHHREPGLAGFGLVDEEIYVEVIADGAHLSPETLKLIFQIKNPERIILVSDSVKGSPASRTNAGPVTKRGVLQGGGMAVSGCVALLGRLGIKGRAIRLAGRENPLRYLKKP